jgi:hypothetical protein
MITDQQLKLIPHWYNVRTYSFGNILEIKTESTTINIIRRDANIYETGENVEIIGKSLSFKGSIILNKSKKAIYIVTF